MDYTAGRVLMPVVPDMRGVQKTIGREGTRAGGVFGTGFDKSSKRGIGRATAGLGRQLKRGLKVGGGAAAVAGFFTVKGGLTRLMGIEDARASLAGLGHDAKAVDKIMGNALASVKGTAFGMADAGKVAASSVAAGIKPGEQLTKHLKLVADAATIAKVDMGEMGQVFNKVAASNKIQGDVIAQLNDQGIPIVQLMAKELGTTAEETVALASKGKINFATFSRAMQSGLGGAALKSGDTMRGSFANLQASLGRIGANLLSGIFPQVRGGFQSLTDALAPMEEKASAVGTVLGNFARDAIGRLSSVQSKLGGFTLDTSKFDGKVFGTKLADGIASGLTQLGGFAKKITSWFGDMAKKVDWVGLGIEFGRAAVPLVAGLALGILDFDVVGLFKSLGEHWKVVLFAALTVIFAPAKLLKPIAKFVDKIPLVGPLVTWFAKGFRKVGRSVFGFIGSLFTNLWKGFRFGMDWMGPSLAARFIGMLRGLWPRLKAWGGGLASRMADGFRFAFFEAGRAIARGVGAVRGWLWRGIKGWLGMYRGAGRWLLSAGKDMLLGFGRGLLNVVPRVRSALGKVPDAVSAVLRSVRSKWDGLRSIMAKPVKWVIDNVVNKLIAAVNTVTQKVSGKKWLTPIAFGAAVATTETGSDRAMARRGGKGGRGGHAHGHTGGKAQRGGGRRWPANTRTLSNNYPGHSGIDIAAAGGSPIMAASAGTVEYVGWGRGFGQAIFVRGADGLLQVYGHSSSTSVRAGQDVRPGTVLGRVGSTGNSTGNHLHFEIAQGAPGSVGNRAATLAWLSGAKMGAAKDGDGPSLMDRLSGTIKGITADGAPSSWFSIPGVVSVVTRAGAQAVRSGVVGTAKNVASKLNLFGGADARSRRAAARARRAAVARRRDAIALRKARARRRTLTAAGRRNRLRESNALTLDSGAVITANFLTRQLGDPGVGETELRRRLKSAQGRVIGAGNRVQAASRQVAIARAQSAATRRQIKAVEAAMKGTRGKKRDEYEAQLRRLRGARSIKALARAEKERTAALKSQTAAQKAANAAAERYREAQDAALERARSIKSTAMDLGSMGSAPVKTAGGIISNLRRAVATTTTWGGVVKALIGAGLRGPILAQFIDAGPSPEAVRTGQSILRSGGIGVINNLQAELKKAADNAGSYAAYDVNSKGGAKAIPGSWMAPSASLSVSGADAVPAGRGPVAIVKYEGMPSDTVDSIAAKTAQRMERMLETTEVGG